MSRIRITVSALLALGLPGSCWGELYDFTPSMNGGGAAGTGVSFSVPNTGTGGINNAMFSFTTSGASLIPEPATVQPGNTPNPITPFHQTPMVSNGESGLSTPLHWRMDAASTAGLVKLTITFASAVPNPTFTLGDIDTGPITNPGGLTDPPFHSLWQDVVVVSGMNGGAPIAPMASGLGPQVSVDANGNVYNTSDPTALVLYGNNGDVPTHTAGTFGITGGNATISFTGLVDTIMISYLSGSATDGIPGQTQPNPESQFISMGDITAVPEVSSFVLTGLTFVFFGMVGNFRRVRGWFASKS